MTQGVGSDANELLGAALQAYVRSLLARPRELDDLAQQIHAKLSTTTAEDFERAPIGALCRIARQAFRALAMDRRAVWIAGDSAAPLVARLPDRHRRLLSAHKRRGLQPEDLCEEFSLSMDVVCLYLSQARTLVRIIVAAIDADEATTVMDREELLAAQNAAAWLTELAQSSADAADRFRDFVRASPLNVREALLAIVLDDVIAEQL